MRVFVKLKETISANKKLAYKLNELERKIEKHDVEIHSIFEAIRQLMTPPVEPKPKIGFRVKESRPSYRKRKTKKKATKKKAKRKVKKKATKRKAKRKTAARPAARRRKVTRRTTKR